MKMIVDGNEVRIQEIDYHRNGVCGIGFHVVRFTWSPSNGKPENFIATIFPQGGAIAVIGVDRLPRAGIAFGEGNSWRGDHFEGVLRDAIVLSEREPKQPQNSTEEVK